MVQHVLPIMRMHMTHEDPRHAAVGDAANSHSTNHWLDSRNTHA